MLAMSAFSLLKGFMGKEDYQRVVREMCRSDGLLWPIPTTFRGIQQERGGGHSGQGTIKERSAR